MPSITENPHAGSFILSEANGDRSRENVVIAQGENLIAGALLGKITSSGEYAEHDPDATDGTQTVAGILIGASDASTVKQDAAAIVRDAEVIEAQLDMDDLDTSETAAAIADLLSLGIIVR